MTYKLPQFTIPAGAWGVHLKDPRILVRVGLGLLLAANLVVAAFAFHVIGSSPQALDQDLTSARIQLRAAQQRLNRSRMLVSKVDKGKTESETFLASYMTDRRHTYSTIINEITQASLAAGMKMGDATIAPLDAIEGSTDLDMMTISVDFEGNFTQLIKFVNLLDRSPRFLIIESMQASPQTKGDLLSVNLKLNAFVRDVPGGAL
jgi:type IV pilus assembly protein PilO